MPRDTMQRGFRLRRARPRDIDALVRLETHFPTDRLRRGNLRHLILRGNADVVVIETRSELIADAIVLYRNNSPTARFYSLVVTPAHRGRGLAETLLDAIEAAALKRGCAAIQLEVRPDNDAAQTLYRRGGYVEVGQIAGFYEDGMAALRFSKALRLEGLRNTDLLTAPSASTCP